MKILNAYCGIGGNRKCWDKEHTGEDHNITAIELNPQIAKIYQDFFPQDKVIVADAHQYLLEHFKEFEFIWSSPPCPSHSRSSTALAGWGVYRYPDMKLYEEIIFLKYFFKGNWVVENVKPYYEPLVTSTIEIDRHLFWCNFSVTQFKLARDYDVSRATKEILAKYHGFILSVTAKDQRKLLRNCVYPPIGLHILNESKRNVQPELFGGNK